MRTIFTLLVGLLVLVGTAFAGLETGPNGIQNSGTGNNLTLTGTTTIQTGTYSKTITATDSGIAVDGTPLFSGTGAVLGTGSLNALAATGGTGTAITLTGSSSLNGVTPTVSERNKISLAGTSALAVVDGKNVENVTPKITALPYLTKKLVAGGTQQFRIGLVGDSFIDNASGVITNRLQKTLGIAGCQMINATLTGAGASQNTNDFANWITGITYTVSGTSSAQFTQYPAGAINTVKYYVVTSPTSGEVKLEYSTGGAWTAMSGTVSAVTGSTSAMVLTGTLPALGTYSTRVTSVSGTTTVIGGMVYDSTSTGAILQIFCRGGINELQFGATTNQSIMGVVIADLAPDVVLYKTAQAASVLGTYYDNTRAMFTNACPTTDWVVVASHPVTDPVVDARLAATSDWLRISAASRLDYFFDSYNLFGDATSMTARWGANDGLHLNAAEDAHWVDALFSSGIFTNGNLVKLTNVALTSPSVSAPVISGTMKFSNNGTTTAPVVASSDGTVGLSFETAGNKGVYFSKTGTYIGAIFGDRSLYFGKYSSDAYSSTSPIWCGTGANATKGFSLDSAAAAPVVIFSGTSIAKFDGSGVTAQFGNVILGTAAGTVQFTGTSAAPVDPVTPVAWRTISISGTSFSVPLYQ